MNGAIPTENGLSANSGVGTYRNSVKSVKNKHKGVDLEQRIQRLKAEKLLEKDLLNIIHLANKLETFGFGLIIAS